MASIRSMVLGAFFADSAPVMSGRLIRAASTNRWAM